MGNFWAPKERTVKHVINDKLKVLRDFGVVDDENELSIKKKFTDAFINAPGKDPDIIADRIARTMIMEKLSD